MKLIEKKNKKTGLRDIAFSMRKTVNIILIIINYTNLKPKKKDINGILYYEQLLSSYKLTPAYCYKAWMIFLCSYTE